MTFIPFPSGNDVGGAKTINEIYWAPLNDVIVNKSFVHSGYTVPASVGSLDIPVAAGKAIVKTTLGAYYVKNTETATITLTNGSVNYVYVTLTLDGNSKVSAAALSKNTTGVLPANSVQICSAVVTGGVITSTTDLRPLSPWKGTGGHAHTGVDGEGTKITFSDLLGTLDVSQLPSTLDGISADMVDGMHADEFSQYNHNHDAGYVNVIGDTMIGDLSITKTDPTLTLDGSSGNAAINLGNPSLSNTMPRIDFHYGIGASEEYNVRIINSANKVLDIIALGGGAILKLNGTNVLVEGQTVVGSDTLDGYHADAFVLKAGSTMTGDLGMEFYGGLRTIEFKSQGTRKWGIYGSAGEMGLIDWHNSRSPFVYNTASGAVSIGTPSGGMDLYSVSAHLLLLHVGGNQYEVWNAGNDGSGSGLDADTVDGIHISIIETDYVHTSGGWSFGHWLTNVLLAPLRWAFGNGSAQWWGIEGHSHGMRCHDWFNNRNVWDYDADTMTLTFNSAHHHKVDNYWIHHSGHSRWSWCDINGDHWRGFEHFHHGIRCHDWENNRSIWEYDADSLTLIFNDAHKHYIGTHKIWHEGNMADLYVYLDARYVKI